MQTDALRAISALRTISSLFLTSATFRLLLSDTLIAAREILSDAAVDVAKVASLVENRALEVDDLVRPPPGTGGMEGLDDFDVEVVKGKSKEVASGVGDIVDESIRETRRKEARSWTSLQDSPDRIKETFLERVKTVRSILQSCLPIIEMKIDFVRP